jgi:hypothetical protein
LPLESSANLLRTVAGIGEPSGLETFNNSAGTVVCQSEFDFVVVILDGEVNLRAVGVLQYVRYGLANDSSQVIGCARFQV